MEQLRLGFGGDGGRERKGRGRGSDGDAGDGDVPAAAVPRGAGVALVRGALRERSAAGALLLGGGLGHDGAGVGPAGTAGDAGERCGIHSLPQLHGGGLLQC